MGFWIWFCLIGGALILLLVIGIGVLEFFVWIRLQRMRRMYECLEEPKEIGDPTPVNGPKTSYIPEDAVAYVFRAQQGKRGGKKK